MDPLPEDEDVGESVKLYPVQPNRVSARRSEQLRAPVRSSGLVCGATIMARGRRATGWRRSAAGADRPMGARTILRETSEICALVR